MNYEFDFDTEGLMDTFDEVREGYEGEYSDERDEVEEDVLEALSEFSGEPVYRLEDRLESTRRLRR